MSRLKEELASRHEHLETIRHKSRRLMEDKERELARLKESLRESIRKGGAAGGGGGGAGSGGAGSGGAGSGGAGGGGAGSGAAGGCASGGDATGGSAAGGGTSGAVSGGMSGSGSGVGSSLNLAEVSTRGSQLPRESSGCSLASGGSAPSQGSGDWQAERRAEWRAEFRAQSSGSDDRMLYERGASELLLTSARSQALHEAEHSRLVQQVAQATKRANEAADAAAKYRAQKAELQKQLVRANAVGAPGVVKEAMLKFMLADDKGKEEILPVISSMLQFSSREMSQLKSALEEQQATSTGSLLSSFFFTAAPPEQDGFGATEGAGMEGAEDKGVEPRTPLPLSPASLGPLSPAIVSPDSAVTPQLPSPQEEVEELRKKVGRLRRLLLVANAHLTKLRQEGVGVEELPSEAAESAAADAVPADASIDSIPDKVEELFNTAAAANAKPSPFRR